MIDFDKLQQQEYNNWGKDIPSHSWCNQINTETEVKFIIDKLLIKKEDYTLDMFCSWGRHSLVLTKLGYTVIGLDISKEMIDTANSISKENNVEIEYINCDINEFSANKHFDNIYSIQSSFFEAWRNEYEVSDLLQKVKKLLKANGKYLFGWNNNYNRADVAEKRWKKKVPQTSCNNENYFPFYFYSFKEHEKILEKNKFKIDNVFNNFIECDFNENKEGLIFIVKNDEG